MTAQMNKVTVGKYTVYYLTGYYPMDGNQILLGVSMVCKHVLECSHVSFSHYRDNPKRSDGIFMTNQIDKVFEFYGEHINKLAAVMEA